MRISTHVLRLYLGMAGTFLTGCSGCSGDELEKNPTPEPSDNGAEEVNCACVVTPTSAGSDAGLQPLSINVHACVPVEAHDDPAAYCQGAVAPWLRNAVEQTTINAQDPGITECDSKTLVCGGSCNLGLSQPDRLIGAAVCTATDYPEGGIVKANPECEGTCQNVVCDDSCVPGGLQTCTCTVVTGCGGPIGPVCSAPSIASSSDALSLAPNRTSPMQSFAAYQKQGDWNHDLSTLKVSATIEACVDLLLTTTCASVSDDATPHVAGTFDLYGAPCPGQACEISLDTNIAIDDFDLEFELLGFTVGEGNLRDLRMSGASGRVDVDATGNGVLPAGSFVFTADGRDTESGDSYRMINGSTHDIPFHIDWASRTISLTNVSLNFASGSALLNLTGKFRPSLLEGIANLDSDQDGVPNTDDTCLLVANPDQADHTPPSIQLGAVGAQTACSRDLVSVTLPSISDSCALTAQPPQLSGAVVQSNGVVLATPISVGTGGQLSLPPGNHVVRWTATDAAGNVATSDQTIQLLPCFAAANGLAMGDRSRSEAASGEPVAIFNYGPALFDVGVEARIGTITSQGSVTLHDRSQIGGSIRTHGTVTRLNDVIVTGSIVEQASLDLPAFPALTTTWPQTNAGPIALEPDQQRSIASGSYGALTIKSRAKLNLQAGSYFFTSVSVEPQAMIQIAGATTLEVRDSITFRGTVIDLSNAAAPTALRYRGTSALFLESGWYGSVLAPNALVVVGGAPGASLRGQLFAKTLEIRPDVVLRAENLTTGGVLQVLPAPGP